MAKSRSTKSKKAARTPAAKKAASIGAKLKIALVGFGTVGRSVAKILSQDTNGPLLLTHICNRSIKKKKDASLPKHIRWTENFDDVLASDADVVVELIGGLQPAGDWVRKALRAGKSVVTANKLLISEAGPELLDLARKMGKRLEFGASVAGGIPAIIGIQEGLAGDRLYKIAGILNGTCNFILTKMEKDGTSFDAALKEAQALGYAEANPSADVDGLDARAKLVILIQAGLRLRVRSEQILCRSISSVAAVDFMYASSLDSTIRQISLAQKETNKTVRLAAAVQPALIPAASLMAHAQGSQNIVTATGEFGGKTMFSGYGAGGDPTAVAVISDLYAIARSAAAPTETLPGAPEVPDSVSGDFTVPHYLRFIVRDRPGIVAALAAILAKYDISIDALLQKPGFPHSALSFVMTLEACDSAVLNRALEEIGRLDFHVEPPLCLPIFLD
ncbi:MAG TPA: homoserine dehydrogenase [Candidatus Acidoferrales bacterium]|nr:homoserine dehydrogenase [Candidatus Acidoferrales bacterium]